MLQRPADAPLAVEHAGSLAPIQDFGRELSAQLQMRKTRWLGSTRATARAWAGRATGRADRRLMFALANATDALARHLDWLVDRLSAQEALTADVTWAYGEDVTRLRAEVTQLRRRLTPARNPRSSERSGHRRSLVSLAQPKRRIGVRHSGYRRRRISVGVGQRADFRKWRGRPDGALTSSRPHLVR